MHRRHIMRIAGVGSLGLLAAGCGFHLRGAYNYAFSSIYVQGDANAPVTSLLRRMLASQVRLIGDDRHKDQADVVLQVHSERLEQVSVVYATGGAVREVQLRQSFSFSLLTQSGKVLIENAPLRLTRDVSYSESEATAKEVEFEALARDMRNDTVQQVLRRLAAVKTP